jgi:GT2 family glycosyltransferase
MPLFSVIIPTFNRRELLLRTIDSIRGGRCDDFEIIVVDDGSTDDTVAQIEAIGPPIRLLRQENSGPAAARNLGITHANGKYIAFCDSDYLWFAWTLDHYRRAIETHDNPAVLIGSLIQFEKPDELATGKSTDPIMTMYDDLFTYIERTGPFGIYTGMLVVETQTLRKTGGFISQRINSEDVDLALRLGTAGPMVRLTQPPAYALRRGGGTVSDQVELSAQGLEMIMASEQAGQYPGGAARRRQRLRLITFVARTTSVRLINAGLSRRAWQIYHRTFRWQLSLGRLRYLIGFPVAAIMKRTSS